MKKLETIKTDLYHIREYYAHLDMIEHPSKVVYPKNFVQTLETYTAAVKQAPDMLQRVFDGLYVSVKTQKELAAILNGTVNYIYILNSRLLSFFRDYFTSCKQG